MISCHETAKRTSEALEKTLPFFQRLEMWLHLLYCKPCLLYRQQIRLLQRALNLYFQGLGNSADFFPLALSPEARKRIQNSINQGLEKRRTQASHPEL